MKLKYLTMLTLFFSSLGFSQSFNYQAAVRDAVGNVVANQPIGVQVSILQGGASGTNVYTETHAVTSNAYGVIDLAVGAGTSTDNFSIINWSLQNHWLDISVDITGGTTYTSIDTSQLQHVPYAMYALNSGSNAFNTTGIVTSNTPGNLTTDDFVFGSDRLADDNSTVNDDARFFFDKSKAAFRAGKVTGSEWDDANIGNESIAMGTNVSAPNIGAVAIGSSSTSSGAYSFIMGHNSTTSATFSTAIGNENVANANGAIAIGTGLSADSYGQTSVGLYNTELTGASDLYVTTDRLFVLGNGIDNANRSDAVTILKNGNTAFSGNVGIGTTTPETTYALNVNGDLNYSGTLTNISDRRYKKNIEPLSGSLNKVLIIEGVQYHMKHEAFPKIKFSDGLQYGVIAQDLEKVLPNLVKTNKEGYKSVNYIGLIPVLIEAVKEQQLQIDAIKESDKQYADLERQVEALVIEVEKALK